VLPKQPIWLGLYKRERVALALEHYVKLTPRNGRYSEAIDRARQTFELEFLGLRARGRVSAETG